MQDIDDLESLSTVKKVKIDVGESIQNIEEIIDEFEVAAYINDRYPPTCEFSLKPEPEPEPEPELEPEPEPEPTSHQDIDKKYEEMRSRYDFRRTAERKAHHAHPPDISGNDLIGVCGIANVGNSCYANSCLQILRAASDWSTYLLLSDLTGDKSPLPDKNTKESAILIGYQDILKTLWSASLPAFIRPMGWIQVVRTAVADSVYEMFAHPIQNDCHEYLVWILDNFHESLKQKKPQLLKKTSISKDPWAQFYEVNHTRVADSFFGLMKKTVTCSSCKNASISYEPFNVLKISCLDNSRPFYDWIKNYFIEEELDDYACERCSPKRTKAIIAHSLWRLPRNLFISVRRFAASGRKDMTAVPEAMELKLTDLFDSDARMISAHGTNCTYKLCGVVDHHGNHMGGHYTAQFLHPVSKNWWWMDDETAQYMPAPRFGTSNYIFLYRIVI
jgi:ubiquitin C-terminal hydrolase